MPINYRVDGSTPVTHAIEPAQHDWSPFQNALRENKNRAAAEEEERQKALTQKANQAAEEAKYNPGNINDPLYNDSLNKIGQKVLDYNINAYKNGTIGSPRHYFGMGQLKNQAQLVKGKGDAMIAINTQAHQNVDKLPDYVTKGILHDSIYDKGHKTVNNNGKDVDWEKINPEEIAKIPFDYYHAINTHDMYGHVMKDIGQRIYKNEIAFPVADPNDGTAMFNIMKSDSSTAKIFKPVTDKYGKVTMVPGVPDEAAKYLMDTNQDVNGEADYQLEKYTQKETEARKIAGDTRDIRQVYNDVKKGIDAEKWKISHIKLNMEHFNQVSKTTENKTTRDANGGKKEPEVALSEPTYDEHVNAFDDKKGVIKGWVPETRRYQYKGEQQPVRANFTNATNIGTDERMDNLVGDQKFYPSRIIKAPYITLPNGKTQYIFGDKEAVLKNKNVKYHWVDSGKMEGTIMVDDPKDANAPQIPKKVEYDVYIPHKEIEDDIEKKTNLKKEELKKGNKGIDFSGKKESDPYSLDTK